MGTARIRSGGKAALQEQKRRQRLWLVAVLAGLACALLNLGYPLENQLRVARNLLNSRPASGDIVIVGIDDRSLAEIDRWPWPRRVHAALIDKLAGAGAERIFFDVDFSSSTNPVDDARLADALRRHPGKVVLPVQSLSDPATGRKVIARPLPILERHVTLASITYTWDFGGAAWALPYRADVEGRSHPTFAAELSRISGEPSGRFPIDYSVDLDSIKRLSASDVLAGRIPRDALASRQIIVGAVSHQLGDIIPFPGKGLHGGVYLHVLGAETLKHGSPRHLGSFIPLLLAAALGWRALRLRSARRSVAMLVASATLALLLPIALERALVFVDIVPGLIFLIILAARLGWLSVRQSAVDRALVHPLSGLPTLNVLRDDPDSKLLPLIVARVTNFAEIAASISVDGQKAMIGQIVGRLALASSGRKLYQGDEGVFAWFADEETAISLDDRLGALHNVFRNPIRVGDAIIDLGFTFGVEAGSERAAQNRLGSAILAAEEAAGEGRRWKIFDAERLKEAPWRLSVLSQLEAAMESGNLWVAYQPQIDLATGETIGAEALVRWTHPERGPISPVDFIPMAESSGRIRALTEFVLGHALQTAAVVHREHPQFGIAVNLSARLIDDPDLVKIVRKQLQEHMVAPERLTLEITETAALGTTDQHLARLAELRGVGVSLSIDDYGTGLSTLDYLRRVEASEIKIDRSFIQALQTNESDRLIVESTIRLAHSLGRHVTAEGIEDGVTLKLLKNLGCDRAQGFYIARPMTWEHLLRYVQQQNSRNTVSG